jgi:hypothetical protein
MFRGMEGRESCNASKTCNEEEKDQSENWRPITLTNIMYQIIFGRIAEYT